MAIKRIVVSYVECDESLDDIIAQVAPEIIKHNHDNHWDDDNFNDILFAVNQKYWLTGDDYNNLESKVNKYLIEYYKHG